METALLKGIFTALMIGFMIGLQRALSNQYKKEPVILGSRTFALISLLGYLTLWLSPHMEYLVPAILLAITALLLGSYYAKIKKTGRLGVTTQFTALLAFLLGAMVYLDLSSYAIFIAVVVIVLLEIKPKLQRLTQALSPREVNAILLLLVMSFVILPLLPDRFVGPYHLFNPYKTWLMAIVIASISFVGYVAIKFLGHRHGLLITGAAGGLISSTAVTISLSQLYAKSCAAVRSYAAGIAIASTFMYLRVLVEAAVVNPQLATKLAIPYLAASLVGLGYTLYLFRHATDTDIRIEDEALSKNPLQLSEAIKFALLFGLIYGAIKLVEDRYGEIGVYVVSLLSGITDVDAITLSLSEMAKDRLDPFTAMVGIVVASATNSIVKLILATWIGGRRLGVEVGKFYLLTLATMFAALLLAKG